VLYVFVRFSFGHILVVRQISAFVVFYCPYKCTHTLLFFIPLGQVVFYVRRCIDNSHAQFRSDPLSLEVGRIWGTRSRMRCQFGDILCLLAINYCTGCPKHISHRTACGLAQIPSWYLDHPGHEHVFISHLPRGELH